MSRISFVLLVVLAAFLAAACGTVATPEWAEEAQGTQAALLATDEHLTAIAPTATPLPPTATPVPPTATPVPPTATPVPPTETPVPPPATTAPTEAPAAAAADPLANADPANGQAVFNATHDTAQGPWACSTCHSVTADELRLVGPGLYNVSVRAETYGTGQTAYDYIHTSIIHPNDFIAPGDPPYPPGLMPQNFEEVLTEQEINDVIAYLFTLKD
ncbi:MAG: c-type cytochrome [Chloroflexi bacterium]|nr:c-type cytochrome [Chloroflexota bacterium]